MTLDDLRAAGQALYGPAWQSALSRDLHVSDRTMRRWVAGAPIPDGVAEDVRNVIVERVALLRELLTRYRAHARACSRITE